MTFDWTNYTGDIKWLQERTIFVCLSGSHAYGTSLPTSDIDYRGIVVPPKEYDYGFLQHFENMVQEAPSPDFTVYSLKKFVRLCVEANANVLEMLFVDPEDVLLDTPAMAKLREHRNLFLSRKVKHRFSGYAFGQLRRLMGHHQWLTNPPTKPPVRQEFGLPATPVIDTDQLKAAESMIRKRLDEWTWRDLEDVEPSVRQAIQDEFLRRLTEITCWSWREVDDKMWLAAVHSIGFDTNFIEMLDKERRYKAALKRWHEYLNWKAERNETRAELEAKHGYDTKHGMHLVRLLRMAREILTEGVVRVRRPDAKDLLAIRDGAWPYEKLVEWAEQQDKELTELLDTCKLPRQPDLVGINNIVMEITESMR